ncbi:MAG TPA: DUF2969 domain-containing protein [Candidatus Tetragenococcus pullicola]|nr:DUF2969 domain-containing protein [Candidatus Tetragenococcus pullicola]
MVYEVNAVKKNKDIQIRIDENKIQRNGVSIPVSELSIGNKKIGQILQLDEKKYQAFLGEEDLGTVRKFDDAVEKVILQWNLTTD